jgi:hypothetical protein
MPYITGDGFVDAGIPLDELTPGKRYRAVREGEWLRVWDDWGEDHLYPERMFAVCQSTD